MFRKIGDTFSKIGTGILEKIPGTAAAEEAARKAAELQAKIDSIGDMINLVAIIFVIYNIIMYMKYPRKGAKNLIISIVIAVVAYKFLPDLLGEWIS